MPISAWSRAVVPQHAFTKPSLSSGNNSPEALYESHSDDVPNAHTRVLGRLTRPLQDLGIEFRGDGSIRLDLPRERQPMPDDRTIRGKIALSAEVIGMRKYLGLK
jgi:hypothetical protein